MEENPTISKPWKSYHKIGFRYAVIFFILFIIFIDWSVNPILSKLYYYGPLSSLLDSTVSWVGKTIFNIQYLIISPYDGEHNDRTYVYLLYFTIVVIAAIGTIIWSLLDGKRKSYQVLYYWITTTIRYYLAFTMFLFALYKFFKVQFPDLGYYTLTERVGDMSPMHLAWAFFGHSYEYNVFMGLVEAGALLLLFRRTTALGAILTMAALANVIVVNISFDVHAKMYPIALFIMALFLFLRDGGSIVRFFLNGQANSLSIIKAPLYKKQWKRILKMAIKVVVVGYFLIASIKDTAGYQKSNEEHLNAKSGYSGLYDINSFTLNEDTLLIDNPLRWKQLIIGDIMVEAIRFQSDSITFINFKVDKKELLLYGNPTDLSEKIQEVYNELGIADNIYYGMDSILIARKKISRLYLEKIDSTTLQIWGKIKNDSVFIIAKRKPVKINEFRLKKRRFHWVNESSYFY
ncbi:hypothetical protein [Ulvibacterium sp.]|uniref:hypothetical protein n=1 Tax=Ulvibacterium sp. TaxID=2665914 RepID=UPI003CC64AC2